MKMVILFVFIAVLLQLGVWVSGNVVFQVHHKFSGSKNNLTVFKAHDSYRHRRILSAVDIPLGGNDSPTSMALYYTKIRIGTPPKDYHVQIDTGSDILWVNCAGCQSCPKKSDIGIPLALYDPKLSSSAKVITCEQDFCTPRLDPANSNCMMGTQCSYRVRYGDGSSTEGYFVKDTVQLDRVTGNLQTASMKGSIKFGCGDRQYGGLDESLQAVDGILGFGQSNSSIISQLASAKKVKKTFSHCLSSSGGGIYAIGEVVHPKVQTTPIMPNDRSHFNIELMAVDVGGEILHLPSNVLNTPAKRGTIIDSGTTLVYLPDELYSQIMKKIMSARPNLRIHPMEPEFQCFRYRGNVDNDFPIITFHFADSLQLKVHPHKYLFRYRNLQHKEWCFAFFSNGINPPEGKDMTLLGDVVLSDKLVTYNMEDKTIGWTDYDCSSNIKVKDEETGRVYEVGAHDISSGGRECGSIFMWLVFIVATKMIM